MNYERQLRDIENNRVELAALLSVLALDIVALILFALFILATGDSTETSTACLFSGVMVAMIASATFASSEFRIFSH